MLGEIQLHGQIVVILNEHMKIALAQYVTWNH